MEIFANADEALQVELILRAVLFIFAFFGLGIMFSAGSRSTTLNDQPVWKRRMLVLASIASYGLAIINVIMTITWIIVFFV